MTEAWRLRHECKFAVPAAVATRVLQRVLPYVEPDPFAAREPEHTYGISSLYLDDAVNTLYRETIEGCLQRFKLRVRCYDDRADSPVFLEIKRRRDRVVEKLRCPIPRAALAAVLAGDTNAAEAELQPHQRESLREFARLQQMQRAFPRLLVRYRRQAYVSRDERDVRVTFDRNLAAAIERSPIVRHSGRFEPLPLHRVIVELKFTDLCPPWMLDAVRACELRRDSFSKYCRSAEALADVGQTAMR